MVVRFAVWTIPTPFLASAAGWVFTEMGRQPWIVAQSRRRPVDQAHRPGGVTPHGAEVVWVSLIGFTLACAALAVVWSYLLRRYVVNGPQDHDSEPVTPTPPDDADVAPLSFAY